MQEMVKNATFFLPPLSCIQEKGQGGGFAGKSLLKMMNQALLPRSCITSYALETENLLADPPDVC